MSENNIKVTSKLLTKKNTGYIQGILITNTNTYIKPHVFTILIKCHKNNT